MLSEFPRKELQNKLLLSEKIERDFFDQKKLQWYEFLCISHDNLSD
jgi:hypothetical protein